LENYSGYSQEYLSLRARQGKLKAVKIGRNWLMAKEWIDEYKNNAKTNDNHFVISQAIGAFLRNLQKNFYFVSQLFKKQSAVLLTATILIFCSAGLVLGFPYIDDLQQTANSDLSFFSKQLNVTANDFVSFLGEQKFSLRIILQSKLKNLAYISNNFFQKEKQFAYTSLIDTILVTENIENYIERKIKENDISQTIAGLAIIQKEFKEGTDSTGKLFKQSFFVLQNVVEFEVRDRQYELSKAFQESKLISDGWQIDIDFAEVKEGIVNGVYNQSKIALSTVDGWQAGLENKAGDSLATGQDNWQYNWRAVAVIINQQGDKLANNIDSFSANLLENVQQGMAWLMIGSANSAEEFSLTFFQKINFLTSLTSQSLRATSQIAWDSAQISGNAIGDKIVEGVAAGVGSLRSLTYSIYNRTSEGLAAGYEFITRPWREKATQQFAKTTIKQVASPAVQIISTTTSSTSSAEEMIAQLVPNELVPKEIISEVIKEAALSQIATINTIREIVKIDESSLILIRSQIAELQRNAANAVSVDDIKKLQDLLAKIQSTPPIYSVASASPVYIGSTGLQISGGANLNSLGVSGLVGISQLSVGGSVILGKTSGDLLTVNSSAEF
ncbi:MAG: hypothetical protein AAB723_00930, partial [Patescibacteria group bacterium]